MKNDGIFFLVAGPAGVGKTTLLKRLVADEKNLAKAVSVTTRAPRAGEVSGVAYHFWSEAEFAGAVERGEFLEHARVHGNWYGTLAKFVLDRLNAGEDVVKDIDVQGVEQMRMRPEFANRIASVFVLPPSHEELLKRLANRSSETAESLAVRLKTAEAEVLRAGEFDYIVVNGELDCALADLRAIRAAEHCRASRQGQFL